MGNNKRGYITELEQKYSVRIQIEADDALIKSGDFRLERIREDGVKVNVPPSPGPRYDRGPAVEMPPKVEDEILEKQKGDQNRRHEKNRENRSGVEEENFKVVEQQFLKNEEKSESVKRRKKEVPVQVSTKPQSEVSEGGNPPPTNAPKKGGWWNRLLGE